MYQENCLTIYDLEALSDSAEYIIITAQFNFCDYDDDGNYAVHGMSPEERFCRWEQWAEETKTHYLCFRENQEIHSISLQEALDMPLSVVKEKYLKKYMRKMCNMLRKDTIDLNNCPVSDDVPDSYLEDMLALRWKENLKLWAMQWEQEG